MPFSIKDRPDHRPPSEQEIKEMSVAVALRKVVDDLFTCQAVADKLRGTEADQPIEALVSHHKQILVEHLEETAWRAVDNFLVQLDDLPTKPETPFPSLPDQRNDVSNRVE